MEGGFISRSAGLLLSLALAVTLLVSPVSATAGNFGNYGSEVVAANGDYAIQLIALPGTQVPCFARQDALLVGEFDDDFYIHLEGGACGATGRTIHDIQISGGSASPGVGVGNLLASSTGSYSAAPTALDPFRFLEIDGKPGFSEGDWVFLDADASTSLTVGDIRISTPAKSGITTPTSRYVNTGDADLAAAASTTEDDLPATITFEAGALAIRFYDANLNGLWGAGDTMVLVPAGFSDRFLSLGQVFMSTSGSRTHGGHALSSTTNALPILTEVAGAFLATTTSACTAPLSSDLYIHFGLPGGSPGTHIQVGDIIVRKGGDTTTGNAASFWTKVTSTSNGAGVQIQDTGALSFFYINNANTATGFTGTDWLYLDTNGVCGATSGALNAGDVRLTPYTGGSSAIGAGTMVVTGNHDLTNYGTATLNPGSAATPWYFLHKNEDRSTGFSLTALTNAKYADTTVNAIWNPATEEVYTSTDGIVTDGDIRLWEADSAEVGSTSAAQTAVLCTIISSVTSATSVEMNKDATVTAASVSITLTRKVADGVTTSTSTTVTSATASFSASDVGSSITGTGIPGATTIASVTSTTAAVLSAAATATGTSVSFVISRTVGDGVTTSADKTVTSATAAFVAADVGSVISGAGIVASGSDCDVPIIANTDFKITGPDGTYNAGAGEFVVYSADAWTTPGFDRAVFPTGGLAGGDLYTATEGTYFGAVGASDQHVFQWAPAGVTVARAIFQVYDVIMSSSPTFVAVTAAEHVPTLTALAAGDQSFSRYDKGDEGISSDVYYFKAGTAPPPFTLGTLRVTAYDATKTAGTLIGSDATVELSAPGSTIAVSATELDASVMFIDLGLGGLDPSDPVYIDLPADIGGTNAGTFGQFDIRANSVTASGSTYAAGTFTKPGEQDLIGYGTAWGAFAGGKTFRSYFFDENRDGAFNGDDILYLVYEVAAPAAFVIPDLLSIRFQGPAGASVTPPPPVVAPPVVQPPVVQPPVVQPPVVQPPVVQPPVVQPPVVQPPVEPTTTTPGADDPGFELVVGLIAVAGTLFLMRRRGEA